MSNTYNKNNQNINSVRFQSKKISNNNNFKSSYQKNEEFTQLANRAAEIKKQREKNNPNLIAKTPNSTGQLRLSQTPRNQNNLRTNVRNSSYRSVTNLNNVSNRRAQNQKRALSQTQKSQVNKEAINQAQRSYAQRQAKRSTTRKSQKTNNQNRKQQRRVMTTWSSKESLQKKTRKTKSSALSNNAPVRKTHVKPEEFKRLKQSKIKKALKFFLKAIFFLILLPIKALRWLGGALYRVFKKYFGKNNAIIIMSVIVVLLICAISLFVKIQYDNHQKQIQIKQEQEEQARLEAIRQEELKKEQERLAAEEEARQLPEKEHAAVYNLKPLGLNSKILDVPLIYQYPELESGCESVALTNMLNYYNLGLKKTDIVDKYLEYDSNDWVNYYVGNPHKLMDGTTIMSPGLYRITSNILKEKNNNLRVFNVSDRNFEELFAYIERGNPVQIWSTLYMSNEGKMQSAQDGYKFFYNCHSVVIRGFDRASKKVYITDSIAGNVSYSISQVKSVYETLGSQAIVVVSQDEVSAWKDGIELSYGESYAAKLETIKQQEEAAKQEENNGEEESQD